MMNDEITIKKQVAERLLCILPSTKYGFKKRAVSQIESSCEYNKIIALEEALQDPIMICEGV